jgi:hypothetical protein
VTAGGTLALAALLALAACSGTLRFDDHSIDAAPVPPDAAAEGPVNCADNRCGFVGGPCTPTQCNWECPQLKSCSGTCGASCSADCEEDSSCMLTAGQQAALKCEAGARCSFVVGPASTVECQGDSDCGARCISDCSLTCAAGAVCTLACGPTAPLRSVTRSARCP